jgi:hypothetical protein
MSTYARPLKNLVDVTGFEPATPCLQIKVSVFWLFGISDLRYRCSVELRLFGLFRGDLRTFSVLESSKSTEPHCFTALRPH